MRKTGRTAARESKKAKPRERETTAREATDLVLIHLFIVQLHLVPALRLRSRV